MTSSKSDVPAASDHIDDIHQTMASSFAPELLDEGAARELGALCARLPLTLTSFWGFETQLGTERAEVDLLVEVKNGSPGHQLLAAGTHLPSDAAAWVALHEFARTWSDADGLLAQTVRNLWLEFDLVAARAAHSNALETPCVFWGPSDEAARDHGGLLRVLDTIAPAFSPFPAAWPRAHVERALTRLPAGARVFQIGSMHARGDVVLRMCVNDITPEQVPEWLSDSGWQGDALALTDALQDVSTRSRVLAVDVDFTASGAGPKLGIECYQDWRETAMTQWQPLLEFAAALGLCTDAKRRALAAFPAKTEFTLQEQVAARRHGYLFPVLYRNLHHIKLSFVGSGYTEAKAYLGVSRPGVNVAGFFAGEASGGSEDGWYLP
jgi:hypothetical protein